MKFAIMEEPLRGHDTLERLVEWYSRFGYFEHEIVELTEADVSRLDDNGVIVPFNPQRLLIIDDPRDSIVQLASMGNTSLAIAAYVPDWREEQLGLQPDIPVYFSRRELGRTFRNGGVLHDRQTYRIRDDLTALPDNPFIQSSIGGSQYVHLTNFAGGTFDAARNTIGVFARPRQLIGLFQRPNTTRIEDGHDLIPVSEEFVAAFNYTPKALRPVVSNSEDLRIQDFMVGETVVGQTCRYEGVYMAWLLVPMSIRHASALVLDEFVEFICTNVGMQFEGIEENTLTTIIDRIKRRAVEETRERMRTREREVQRNSEKLHQSIRAYEADRILLQGAEQTLSKETNEIVQQAVRQLKNYKSVNAITADNEKLYIRTNKIFCRNPATGTLHELGRYIITVNLDGNYNYPNLNYRNLDRQINRFQAPHVDHQGTPCLGNMQDAMTQAIGTGDITTIVTMALAFLEDVNPADDWGRNIVQWPEANEGEYQELYGSKVKAKQTPTEERPARRRRTSRDTINEEVGTGT